VRHHTHIGATIGVDQIPVIALLESASNVSIATLSGRAIIKTGVIVVHVPVVAFFHPFPHRSIAAAGRDTAIATSIGIDTVSIIASLPARPKETIPAGGKLAGAHACIRII
jgi:hypothetical protein